MLAPAGVFYRLAAARVDGRRAAFGAAALHLRQTMLHVAARDGHAALVELLLSHGADVHAKERLFGCHPPPRGQARWLWRWNNVSVAYHLHVCPFNLPESRNSGRLARVTVHAHACAPAFVRACVCGVRCVCVCVRAPKRIACGTFLFTCRCDLYRRCSPLHFAAREGRVAILESLLSHGADVYSINYNGSAQCASKHA